MLELVWKIDGFNFYLFKAGEGFQIVQIQDGKFKFLKKGRIFLTKEFALEYLQKYIKQGTHKTDD